MDCRNSSNFAEINWKTLCTVDIPQVSAHMCEHLPSLRNCQTFTNSSFRETNSRSRCSRRLARRRVQRGLEEGAVPRTWIPSADPGEEYVLKTRRAFNFQKRILIERFSMRQKEELFFYSLQLCPPFFSAGPASPFEVSERSDVSEVWDRETCAPMHPERRHDRGMRQT